MFRLRKGAELLFSAAHCLKSAQASVPEVCAAYPAAVQHIRSQGWANCLFSTAAVDAGETSLPPMNDAVKQLIKDNRRYVSLVDKDAWDELWAYEDRYGTETFPIEVPSTLSERIIGVTDPEDDTLIIWGILHEGEPPKQLVTQGEFYVLKKVEYIPRVGDYLDAVTVKAVS